MPQFDTTCVRGQQLAIAHFTNKFKTTTLYELICPEINDWNLSLSKILLALTHAHAHRHARTHAAARNGKTDYSSKEAKMSLFYQLVSYFIILLAKGIFWTNQIYFTKKCYTSFKTILEMCKIYKFSAKLVSLFCASLKWLCIA